MGSQVLGSRRATASGRRQWVACVAALAALACGCTGDTTSGPAPGPVPDAPTTGTDAPPETGPDAALDIGLPRAVHRATRLRDGSVLLTGGCSTSGCEGVDAAATAELVEPDGTAAPGPSMSVGRISHTATLLGDGRVLVIGGYPGEGQPATATMELYDPGTAAFADAGVLRQGRADHTATLLPDGRVLVAGGRGADGRALSTVEIVDVRTGAGSAMVTAGPSLPGPRTAHTATRVGDCVLLVGGTGATDLALRSTTTWCAATDGFEAGPPLVRARVKHAVASLPGGGIWVVGGAPSTESRTRFRDTELLLPRTGRFVAGPDLPSGRYKIADAIATLADGRVVVAGGRRLVVFDPATGILAPVDDTLADLGASRSFQTATALRDGRVLVAGGYDRAIDPSAAAWLVPVAAPRQRGRTRE